MRDRVFTFGERVVIPFAIVDENDSTVDMSSDTLTLYVRRPGSDSADTYTSGSYVTWTSQATGVGYWVWTEADSEDQDKWPIGKSFIDMWHIPSAGGDDRHLGSARVTIRRTKTGGNP